MNESIMNKQKKRIEYLDFLRILALFAVIVIHVDAQNYWNVGLQPGGVETFEWKAYTFLDSMSKWSVPIFVMISGALFLNARISIKTLYTKYIFRIICAYVVWSSIYAVVTNTNGSEKTMLYNAIQGYFHLWFLPMIIGLYLCIPIMDKIVEDSKVLKYFLLVSFVFTFLIPDMLNFINDYGIDFFASCAYSSKIFLSNMNFRLIGGYSFYFMVGYFLDRNVINKKQRILIYFLGVCGFALTMLLTDRASVAAQISVTKYYGYLTLNIMLESIAVFVWFKYNAEKIMTNKNIKSVVAKLSKYCFGAYLVHVLIIDKLVEIDKVSHIGRNPLIAVPVFSFMALVIAFIISGILNHIPIVKKYFV